VEEEEKATEEEKVEEEEETTNADEEKEAKEKEEKARKEKEEKERKEREEKERKEKEEKEKREQEEREKKENPFAASGELFSSKVTSSLFGDDELFGSSNSALFGEPAAPSPKPAPRAPASSTLFGDDPISSTPLGGKSDMDDDLFSMLTK